MGIPYWSPLLGSIMRIPFVDPNKGSLVGSQEWVSLMDPICGGPMRDPNTGSIIIIPKGLDLRRDCLRSRFFEDFFRSLVSSLHVGPLPSPLFLCFASCFLIFPASFLLLVLLFPSQMLVFSFVVVLFCVHRRIGFSILARFWPASKCSWFASVLLLLW